MGHGTPIIGYSVRRLVLGGKTTISFDTIQFCKTGLLWWAYTSISTPGRLRMAVRYQFGIPGRISFSKTAFRVS